MTDRASLSIRPMRVRPMQSGDIPRVMEIAEGLAEAPHWTVATYEAALHPNSEPRRIALVAEALEPEAAESQGIAGFVVASLVAGEAELESIAVAAEAQRRGIGGKLLGNLLGALKEPGVARINLEVRASNEAAMQLYTRHGFRKAGRRSAYYADPVEDAVLLELDLGGPKAG